ncbi:amidohydrolase family protein [Sphingobium sp.]|uniref:amidohydrolase family protein n=1 Tax=Sphingobium sp. TaxID=1912891 RepID=UPI002E1C55A6
MRTLIKDAIVISMDPAVGDFRRASILVDGDRIAAVGPDIAAADAEVIDGTGMIALPGLIDAHRHVWQGALTMVAADADLHSYFGSILSKIAPVYTEEDVRIGNLTGALQAIDAGVTSVFDWSHIQHSPAHSDAAIGALKDSGMRVVFGYGFPNLGPEWFFESRNHIPEDIRRVREDILPGDDGLVTMALALRGPEMSGIDVTAHDLAVGRELGLFVSVHVGNGDFGKPYKSVHKMREAGLLGSDIQYVHGNSLDDDSIAMIADSGGQMVATPTVELQMQFGYPATTRFLAKGVRPGIGADVVTSTDTGLFAQMASTFQIARHQAYEAGTPSIDTRDVLSFATIDGARSIGIADRTGSLTPGKKADIILVRTPDLFAMNDPVAYVVLAAGPQAVDMVMIDGVVRKRDGRLVRDDLAALADRLEASRTRLMDAAGIAPPIAAYA